MRRPGSFLIQSVQNPGAGRGRDVRGGPAKWGPRFREDDVAKAGATPIVWRGGFPNILANGPASAGQANRRRERGAGCG
jgi:hypothetical protein